MKKIFNIMIVTAAAAALFSCNKAEYVTENFVSFNTNKYSFDEDAGIVAIPLSLYGADECTVTFSATDGTAVQGTDFTLVDKDGQPNSGGVVNVNSDKTKSDSIYVKLNYNPAMTKGKSFTLNLVSSATEGVVIRGTQQCSITINDLEYAVSQYFGSWATEDESIAFEIEEYDITKDEDEIAEYYPECCIRIPAAKTANISDLNIGGALYGYYKAADKTIRLYPEQAFNAYNFGSIGVNFVVLENSDDYTQDVIFNTGDKEISLASGMTIQLYSYSAGERTPYWYDKFAAGTTLKKQ